MVHGYLPPHTCPLCRATCHRQCGAKLCKADAPMRSCHMQRGSAVRPLSSTRALLMAEGSSHSQVGAWLKPVKRVRSAVSDYEKRCCRMHGCQIQLIWDREVKYMSSLRLANTYFLGPSLMHGGKSSLTMSSLGDFCLPDVFLFLKCKALLKSLLWVRCLQLLWQAYQQHGRSKWPHRARYVPF